MFDFYGIRFTGHPDMRRVFLREDWVGYPFRKDDETEKNNPLRMTNEPLADDTEELVLNAEVDELDKPMEGVGCGECRRCMDACPTGAIVKPMTINTSRCISCHTIEAEPSAYINLNGWIFGCDECQNCCPYNKKAKPHSSALFDPMFDPREITAEQWMTMTEEEFAEKFGSTPLKRSGLERIKANIRRD